MVPVAVVRRRSRSVVRCFTSAFALALLAACYSPQYYIEDPATDRVREFNASISRTLAHALGKRDLDEGRRSRLRQSYELLKASVDRFVDLARVEVSSGRRDEEAAETSSWKIGLQADNFGKAVESIIGRPVAFDVREVGRDFMAFREATWKAFNSADPVSLKRRDEILDVLERNRPTPFEIVQPVPPW